MKFQTLTETLTLNTVINLFRSQWWSTIKPSLMQMGQYSLDMVERALLWLYEYWLWFWLWRQQQQNLSFHITLWFMMRHQSIPSLVTNGCNVHKIFSGQNLDIWTGCRPPPPFPNILMGDIINPKNIRCVGNGRCWSSSQCCGMPQGCCSSCCSCTCVGSSGSYCCCCSSSGQCYSPQCSCCKTKVRVRQACNVMTSCKVCSVQDIN